MSKDFYINVYHKGNYLLVNEYKDGIRCYNKYEFQPSLYFIDKSNINSKYKTIEGIPLSRKLYNSISDCYKNLEDINSISNMRVFGTKSYKMQWINENYDNIECDFNLIRNVFIDIETCCELGFPDPTKAPEPINAITYYDSILKKYYVMTLKDYGKVVINDEECILIECEHEKQLLETFLKIWKGNYPDNISGWNIEKFDIPYIINRITKVLGKDYVNLLSPFNIVRAKTYKDERAQDQVKYDIIGINDLDYLELYKKYSMGERPSYSLKYITTFELGETKLDHEEFANMHLFYKENYQKFIEYNIQDVKLITKLDDKLKYIQLVTQIAYLAKINFRECFSPVATWESLIYNHQIKKGILFEIKDNDIDDSSYTGAFVKQPVPAKYNWVVSFDLNSLYPSLIRQFNISPEKIISEDERNRFIYSFKDKNYNLYQALSSSNSDIIMNGIINKEFNTDIIKQNNIVLTGSGYLFKRDSKGFMPEIMEYIYNQRRSVKKLMLEHESTAEKIKIEIHKNNIDINDDTNKLVADYIEYSSKSIVEGIIQQALKIVLNSGYGAFANKFFQFYDLRLSESITRSGQCAVRWMEIWLNKFLNQYFHTNNIDYVITIDTDSLYLNLENLISKVKDKQPNISNEECIDILDKFAHNIIEPQIQQGYEEFYVYTNSFENQMVMKRECLCSSGVFVAKKRYCLNVFDNEGVRYEKPKLKIKGLDVVRSSTPDSIKGDIKEVYKIILEQDEKEVQKFVKSVKSKFRTLLPNQISITSSVNDIEKYLKDYIPASGEFAKGTPIHVKAAISYNNLITNLKLDKIYQYINSGDKIKYIFLKPNNICRNEAIAFLNFFPKEFNLDEYIDYDKTFERVFIGPLKNIMEPINWNWEEVNTLEDLFG